MILPPHTQKLIDQLDFEAEKLELQYEARKDIVPTGPSTQEARLKGTRARNEARAIREYIQNIIKKHYIKP